MCATSSDLGQREPSAASAADFNSELGAGRWRQTSVKTSRHPPVPLTTPALALPSEGLAWPLCSAPHPSGTGCSRAYSMRRI